MGTDRDGDSTPFDGDSQPLDFPDLPGLPDGVRVPDDLADLADEAERIRVEVYGTPSPRPAPGPRRRRRLGISGAPSAAPLVIMCLAVVITLVSLFAIALSGPRDQPDAVPGAEPTLPEVTLTDGAGRPAALAGLTPAAILLVERCTCDGLIMDTVDAAPPGVTVVVIGTTMPQAPPDLPPGAPVRLLADPDGAIRKALGLGAPPAAAATVVLAGDEQIIQVNPAADSVEPYQATLADLGR